MREISDIDIFVRKTDLKRVKHLLLQNGYTLVKPVKEEPVFERYAYHYSFRRERSGRSIEIHWKFVRDSRLLSPNDWWPWAGLKPIEFDHISTQTFASEDWLLLLCGHGAKHRWPHLGNICDVSELIRRQGIDWDQVEAKAKKLGTRRILHLGLLLAHELLQAPVPEEILDHARADKTAEMLAAKICTSIRAGESGIVRLSGSGAEGVAFDLQVRERFRDKSGWILQHLFFWEPNQHDRSLLPAAPTWVHRWLRVARLVMKYGYRFSRGMLRKP